MSILDNEGHDPQGFGNTPSHSEVRSLRAALKLIAGMKGLTLIAPSMGDDADKGHQIGANKAFNQCADIAQAALDGC